jgi:3-methyl-2-oxobutanoate hydroxymethyltransferase
MTVQGLPTTAPVTMEEQIYHAKAITRAVKHAIVVGDLPFGAYHACKEEAIRNAVRMQKEGGCDVVKVEGGKELAPMIRAVVDAGIPVMGHIGLTPQLMAKLGGFRVQGRDVAAALRLLEDALTLEEAGCFAIVLECIPDRVAKLITERVGVPTISCGAGPWCSGQNKVLHDMIGLSDRPIPRFNKKYVDVATDIRKALEMYQAEVRAGQFPATENCFTMKDEDYEQLLHEVNK